MEATWPKIIKQIHQSPCRAVIAITGGGSTAISELLSAAGASNTILEAIVPYDAVSLSDWLGRPPDRYCRPQTALAMAVVAYQRAQYLIDQSADSRSLHDAIVGVGCTASIRSHEIKRGEHRCYVATQTGLSTRLYSIEMKKGSRTRLEEEGLVSEIVLKSLADACGIVQLPPLPMLTDETLAAEFGNAPRLLADVWKGRRPFVWSMGDGELQIENAEQPLGLLCGSFAPRHEAHLMLREAAELTLKGSVAFELSVFNADKHPLDYLTIERRRRQFDDFPLVLTNAPTFVEKARILPRTVFVVGVDTAERILDPRFYNGQPDQMRTALDEIRAHSCRFLVAGRMHKGHFQELRDTWIPAEFADLFEGLPAEVFRCDQSSTEIRQNEDYW